MKLLALFTLIALPLLADAPAADAQTANSLAIGVPATGTTVTAGQTLAIGVAVTGAFPNGIAIIGQDPIGATTLQSATGSTAMVSLTIPVDIAPGTYTLTAAGTDSNGNLVASTPVNIAVEMPTAPNGLTVSPTAVTFPLVGQTLPVIIIGTFAGGAQADVTGSTLLTFASANPQVATAQNGIVTAVGVGQTYVYPQYEGLTATITVNVLAAPTAVVPNVVNLTQSAATIAIMNAGLILGAVTSAASSSIPSGTVISETPAAATAVGDGTAVNLVVSSGTPTVIINMNSAPTIIRTAQSLTVTIPLRNAGNITALTVSESSATLNGIAATSVAASISNLAAGGVANLALTFPGSAGASGTSAPLSVKGSYTSASVNGNWGLSLRGVPLP